MIKEAIEKILDLSGIHTVEIENKVYSSTNLKRVRLDNEAPVDALLLNTLDGLIDYAQSLFQTDFHGDSFEYARFHVVSYDQVDLIGPLQHNNQNARFMYATARLPENKFSYGRWIPLEQFVIELQSKFKSNFTVDHMLSMFGSLASTKINEKKDDGFSQSVEIRMGLRVKETAAVENPVLLVPYRTFREVDQPSSNFILRLKEVSDGIAVSLHEADGSTWKIQAIENIREYLQDRMSDWGPDLIPLGVIS